MSAAEDFQVKLAAVLRRRIPGCIALESVERLSGGATQETYRLQIRDAAGTRQLAMRRAAGGTESARTPEHPGLRTEALIMRVAREAGVPEPEIYAQLEPNDGLGDGFIMQWLDGETLGARIVRAESLAAIRPKLAYECGQIIARIHALDLHKAGLDRLLATIDSAALVDQTWARYKRLNTPQPMIDYTARWLNANLPKISRTTLVHSDFRNGNIMIGSTGVMAILDWELAYIGDPMRDLGWICTNSWRFGSDMPVGGFGQYEDLFRGYESVSGLTVDASQVKFWEVFGSFWWAIGCLAMANQFRTGPDRTVERPGIGRRSSECQVDCANLLLPGQVALVEGMPLSSTLDLPRTDELVSSVRDFLRTDVMPATAGRTNFLARVAANSLDIVLREFELGPPQRAAEQQRLQALFDVDDNLENLRWRLVHALRAGMPLDKHGLADHLRHTVVNQLAIDQPGYSGLKMAVESSPN